MKLFVLRLLPGVLSLAAALSLSEAAAAPTVAAPTVDFHDHVQAGDVVFIQIGGPLFSRVAASSHTWVSHVGIIVGQRNGQWMVAESAVMFSRVTPLDTFLARSVRGQYSIKRFRDEMTPGQIALLNAAVDRRLGKVYDFGFNFDSPRSEFCSKFVYQVVQESSGVQLGQVETFRSLLALNPHSPVWFWRTWFFGRIPWDRKTITPESQFDSPLLVTVSEHT